MCTSSAIFNFPLHLQLSFTFQLHQPLASELQYYMKGKWKNPCYSIIYLLPFLIYMFCYFIFPSTSFFFFSSTSPLIISLVYCLNTRYPCTLLHQGQMTPPPHRVCILLLFSRFPDAVFKSASKIHETCSTSLGLLLCFS